MIIFFKKLLSGQNDLESWKQGHNRVYQTKTYRKWYITHWYDHLIFFKMAAILNFKMAANLQHSQEVTLDFLFDFDVTYNVSKGISSTISGSMFAPSNHTNKIKVSILINILFRGKHFWRKIAQWVSIQKLWKFAFLKSIKFWSENMLT